MPPVRRKVMALRGLLDPEMEGALSIGPNPRIRHTDPDFIERLREAYDEHHDAVAELDSAAGVPAMRSWAFWQFESDVPPELREGSALDYHERELARARWLASTGRLYRWELGKLRRLSADDVAADWHPWKDMLAAVLAATPKKEIDDG